MKATNREGDTAERLNTTQMLHMKHKHERPPLGEDTERVLHHVVPCKHRFCIFSLIDIHRPK